MAVASGEVPSEKEDAQDAKAQPVPAATESLAQVTAPEAGDGGAAVAPPRQEVERPFFGVAMPGNYSVVSRTSSLWASDAKENRSKVVPGFQTVYWHTRIARQGKLDLFLSPGVKILLSPDDSALYMAAVTLRGLSAQLLVCGEDHRNVRLLPVTTCAGVEKPSGHFDDGWVRPALEMFGQEQEEREREGTDRWLSFFWL
jgi:hypothetical protein